MTNIEIHYSIGNGGDGSAYLVVCESALVAQLHQDCMVNNNEGWAEDCTGSFTVTGEGQLSCGELLTAEALIQELKEEMEWVGDRSQHLYLKAIKELEAV